MRNKLENFLLAVLLGISVLLGLSFWLNTKFGFNMFCAAHWDKLSQLQAEKAHINIWFYVSIGVAIFVFIFGLYIICRPRLHSIFINHKSATVPNKIQELPQQPVQQPQPEQQQIQTPVNSINLVRPPKLNLPRNMAQVAAAQQTKQTQQQIIPDKNPYIDKIAEIFTNNAYLVKKNPTINGFTPDLFAIGNNEVLWIGGVDCDMSKLSMVIEKLKSIFMETLSDIQITIYSFILDNKKQYESKDNIFVFHDIDDLSKFISENQGADISPEDQENFDAYSEYIDTIIQYVKNA